MKSFVQAIWLHFYLSMSAVDRWLLIAQEFCVRMSWNEKTEMKPYTEGFLRNKKHGSSNLEECISCRSMQRGGTFRRRRRVTTCAAFEPTALSRHPSSRRIVHWKNWTQANATQITCGTIKKIGQVLDSLLLYIVTHLDLALLAN